MRNRLTIYPAMDSSPDRYYEAEFDSVAELDAVAKTVADMMLFIQDDLGLMHDETNMFIREEYVGGEWEEL